MTLYLDNQSNLKEKPNENFARELMELFTLGEGNYTEQDIKEAARAFTGWQVNRKNGQFRINGRQHDNGSKTFFGQQGNFGGTEVIDIIFQEKADVIAKFMVTKLWQSLVSTDLDETEIKRLSALFVQEGFELEPLLRAILLSDAFRHQKSYNALIKSPVELVVGLQRVFNLEIYEQSLIRQMGNNLGQMLFAPPNVKGWPGGSHWITSSSFLARVQLMSQVTRAIEVAENEKPKMAMAEKYGWLTKYSLVQWQALLLPWNSSFMLAVDDDSETVRHYDNAISAMLRNPEFQLK